MGLEGKWKRKGTLYSDFGLESFVDVGLGFGFLLCVFVFV